jgi:uncharacterized protein (TIGR02147 family)
MAEVFPTPSFGASFPEGTGERVSESPEISGKSSEISPIVFEYSDYHVYLDDWMRARKRERGSFSYQEFANRAGLKSRSFLRLVCKGEKQLSPSAALKVSKAIRHTAREAEYFAVLVNLNNAKTLAEKSLHLDRLRKIHKPSRGTLLSVQQYDLFGKWYVIPVWELVTVVDFHGDYRILGRLLDPPIGAQEARYALDLLLSLQLIQPRGSLYVQTKTSLHTRDELRSEAVKSYQIQTMQLAQEALGRCRQASRHIGTLSLGLDETSWNQVQEKVRIFRQELADIAHQVQHVDRVYQCNIQLFPLTRIPVSE